MNKPDSPTQEPHIQFLVPCPRSGSTLLIGIFAQFPVCELTSRLILTSKVDEGDGFGPNNSILQEPSHYDVYIGAKESGKRFFISKEELGNDSNRRDCLYDICPSPSTYAMVRPVFLIRDPIRVFDSWKNVGWNDEQSLVHCYTKFFRMQHQAPAHAVSCPFYEHFIQEPQREVRRICVWWDVPFSEIMLDFKKPFGSSFIFSSDREKSIYLQEKPLGLFRTVEASSSIQPDVLYHGLLSNTEKETIEEQLERLYLHCWGRDILRLRTIIADKAWVGFDLDDTLHEFRRSAGTATNKILDEISKRFGIPMPELKDQYSRILKDKTENAFSDGRTSFDYRMERFTSVLAHFSLPQDDQFVDQLLETYEETFMGSLELKCGAIGLLSTLKGMCKKIVIITEGPQDAQERTIHRLGIGGYVDFLATTHHFGVTKTNGLFPKVLEHLGISPGDIAYIGDNEQRDMKPAMAEGIFSIHLAETKHISLNTFPPQINSLRKLQYILSHAVS